MHGVYSNFRRLPKLSSILNFSFNLILPEVCVSCKKEHVSIGKPLCISCLETISFIDISKRCNCCGSILANHDGNDISPDCSNCSRKKPFFKTGHFLWLYQSEIRHIVKMAKFHNRRNAIHFLTSHIPHSNLNIVKHSKDILILRMTSSKKFIKVLSKELHTYLGIPVIEGYKKKKTKIQSKNLHEKDRFLEIEKNLVLKQEIIPLLPQYKKIIIIDDVWTSGATINLAAKLLVDAGVPSNNIEVLAFFRRDKNTDIEAVA